MKKTLRTVGLIFIVALIGVQFIPVDRSVPEVNPEKDFLILTSAPVEVAELMKKACYDCHSYETTYPWYAQVAPFSWMIQNHVNHGREHLNFAKWSELPVEKKLHKMEECAEEIGEGEMPLKGYVALHSEAKLTNEQRAMLVDWFNGGGSSFQKGNNRSTDYEEEDDHDHEGHEH
jgi:hypothetical protein